MQVEDTRVHRARIRNDKGVGENRRIRRRVACVVLGFLFLLPLSAREASADSPAPETPFVVLCPITGLVDEGLAVVVERAVAEAQDAKALILLVDTFGGRVDSAIAIANTLSNARCPTIAYVHGAGAISAGALISYACQHIYLSPSANIGAAQPVMMTSEGVLPTGEKEVSFMRAKMRSLAEANGHNPDIAEAMVDKDIELRARTDAEGRVFVYNPMRGGGAAASPKRDVVDRIFEPIERALPSSLNEVKDAVREAVKEAVNVARPAGSANSAGATEPAPQTDAGEEIVCAGGKLLTLTAHDAFRYGVVAAISNNVQEVMAHYGIPGLREKRIAMTTPERIFRFLTNPTVAGILLMIGLGGIYLEFKTPGAIWPLVVGAMALILYFGARSVLGIGDWAGIVLVLAGLGLLGVEIFYLPGITVAGVAGVLCLLGGIYLSLTNVVIPQYAWDYDRLYDAMQSITVFVAAFFVFVWATYKLLPKTSLYGRIVLQDAQLPEAGYVVQTDAQERCVIGLEGVAETVLRPAGRGRFADKTLDVVTRGDYIESGAPIVVVEVEGNRLVVDSRNRET